MANNIQENAVVFIFLNTSTLEASLDNLFAEICSMLRIFLWHLAMIRHVLGTQFSSIGTYKNQTGGSEWYYSLSRTLYLV